MVSDSMAQKRVASEAGEHPAEASAKRPKTDDNGAPADEAQTKNEKVQCFGRKKQAVAVALVRTGSGNVRVNGCPLTTLKPDILRVKVYEPLLLLGKERWGKVDIRLRVKGGGFV